MKKYLVETGFNNRHARRASIKQAKMEARLARRPEIKRPSTKRMDRPSRIDAANRGYDFIHNFIDRGIRLQSR